MKAAFEVIVAAGDVLFVHDDDLADELAALGPMTTRRASHVEPSGEGWTADMAPVGGGVLGPFARRDMALAAEVSWLRASPEAWEGGLS